VLLKPFVRIRRQDPNTESQELLNISATAKKLSSELWTSRIGILGIHSPLAYLYDFP